MRVFAYIVIACGLGLGGFGLFQHYAAMGGVKKTAGELETARGEFEVAKGTAGEEAARAKVEGLRKRILEEQPPAAKAKANAIWWMGGGGFILVIGLVGMLKAPPRKRKTRSSRFWA